MRVYRQGRTEGVCKGDVAPLPSGFVKRAKMGGGGCEKREKLIFKL